MIKLKELLTLRGMVYSEEIKPKHKKKIDMKTSLWDENIILNLLNLFGNEFGWTPPELPNITHSIVGERTKISIEKVQAYGFSKFLFWSCFRQIKKIRPFWYINYSKESARDFLKKEFGWKYYGGHHLENTMTAFYHKVYNPRKFNSDLRNNTFSVAIIPHTYHKTNFNLLDVGEIVNLEFDMIARYIFNR